MRSKLTKERLRPMTPTLGCIRQVLRVLGERSGKQVASPLSLFGCWVEVVSTQQTPPRSYSESKRSMRPGFIGKGSRIAHELAKTLVEGEDHRLAAVQRIRT